MIKYGPYGIFWEVFPLRQSHWTCDDPVVATKGGPGTFRRHFDGAPVADLLGGAVEQHEMIVLVYVKKSRIFTLRY